MNKLKLLWELEEYNIELDRFLNDLDNLNEKLKKHEMEDKLKNIYARLDRLDNNRSIIKESILKYENSLGQYEFQVETLNTKLYKENIVDIKQLEYLSKEKDSMEEKIEQTEREMLAYMEEEEIIEEKYEDNLLEAKEFKESSKKESSSIKAEIKSVKENIRGIEASRNTIIDKIDKNTLERYEGIRKRKVKPIVLVENKTCLGCNMMLPLYQLEDVRAKSKIVNCESCGRILYLRDK